MKLLSRDLQLYQKQTSGCIPPSVCLQRSRKDIIHLLYLELALLCIFFKPLTKIPFEPLMKKSFTPLKKEPFRTFKTFWTIMKEHFQYHHCRTFLVPSLRNVLVTSLRNLFKHFSTIRVKPLQFHHHGTFLITSMNLLNSKENNCARVSFFHYYQSFL